MSDRVAEAVLCVVSWSDNEIESNNDVDVDFIVVSWSDNGIVSASEVEVDFIVVS